MCGLVRALNNAGPSVTEQGWATGRRTTPEGASGSGRGGGRGRWFRGGCPACAKGYGGRGVSCGSGLQPRVPVVPSPRKAQHPSPSPAKREESLPPRKRGWREAPDEGASAASCFCFSLPAIRQSQKQRRSEEHTSELQSLMRTSYAVFCLKKKTTKH